LYRTWVQRGSSATQIGHLVDHKHSWGDKCALIVTSHRWWYQDGVDLEEEEAGAEE